MARQQRIAALLGPTASGKTRLAGALHRCGLPIEVVGCDALQIYRRIDAATAKPSAEERRQTPHHLVDLVDPTEAMDAGRYVRLAEAAMCAIDKAGGWPLLVGGTSMYYRSLVRGLADIPAVPPEIRAALAGEHQARGAEAMYAELRAVDPQYAATTPANNRQRVLRALEVYRSTGRAFSSFHRAHRQREDKWSCLTIILEPERSWLVQRIEERVAEMVPVLLAEVEELLGSGLSAEAPAMSALGYSDAVAVVTGKAPRHGLEERLATAHRQYAKRQRTWLRSIDAALRIEVVDEVAVDAAVQALRGWFG